jgi:hypothetical protein
MPHMVLSSSRYQAATGTATAGTGSGIVPALARKQFPIRKAMWLVMPGMRPVPRPALRINGFMSVSLRCVSGRITPKNASTGVTKLQTLGKQLSGAPEPPGLAILS